MNKKGKKAQVYIISAIIIIVIILSLATIQNRAVFQEKPTKFYYLSGDFEREGSEVLKYSLYNERNVDENIREYIDSFKSYVEFSGQNTEFFVVKGNSKEITTIEYTCQGGVDVGTESSSMKITSCVLEKKETKVTNPTNPYIQEFKEQIYTIPLLETENIAFVFSKDDEFNKFISTNIASR